MFSAKNNEDMNPRGLHFQSSKHLYTHLYKEDEEDHRWCVFAFPLATPWPAMHGAPSTSLSDPIGTTVRSRPAPRSLVARECPKGTVPFSFAVLPEEEEQDGDAPRRRGDGRRAMGSPLRSSSDNGSLG